MHLRPFFVGEPCCDNDLDFNEEGKQSLGIKIGVCSVEYIYIYISVVVWHGG